MIEYRIDQEITIDQFAGVLKHSGLAERRPVEDRDCLRAMLAEADLLVTAWQEDQLVGIARSVTDFSYCCYLSDLAVAAAWQSRGIGRELIRMTRSRLGPRCSLILLAAPAASEYYPRLGFSRHESAWILKPEDEVN